MPSPYWQLNDPDWLWIQYLERGRTAADIASKVGCPHKTVDRALQRHGVRRPPHRMLADVPVGWVRERYERRGRSINDLTGEVGLSPTSVRRALVEGGIPINNGRLPAELEDPTGWPYERRVTNAELARRLGQSPAAMAEALGCHRTSVAAALRENGLR